jgi:hypothetical protein
MILSRVLAWDVAGSAIHAEGLSKRYGDTLALDALDLNDLPASLDWIPAGHYFLLADHRRIPETQLH